MSIRRRAPLVALALAAALVATAVSVANPSLAEAASPAGGVALNYPGGALAPTTAPAPPAGVTYTDLAYGYDHRVYLRSDGQIVGTGVDAHGATALPPLPVGVTYTAVAAGADHTLALRSDGVVVGAGRNNHGQATVPALPAGVVYTAIAAGWNNSMFLRSDGQVVASGEGFMGSLNLAALPTGYEAIGISTYFGHSLVLLSDGTIIGIGSNDFGQSTAPTLPSGMTYTQVAAGYLMSAAVRSDGQVVTFGIDASTTYAVPALPPGVVYTSVTTGTYAIVFTRSDGTVVSLGLNPPQIPVAPPGTEYVAVAIGYSTGVGIIRSTAATSVALTESSTEAGGDIELTATVTSNATVPALSGTVTFVVDEQLVITAAVDPATGIASTRVPSGVAGAYPVQVAYSGSSDAGYAPSSTTGTVTVTPAPPTHLVLAPLVSTVTAGNTITFDVTGADAFGNAHPDLSDQVVVTAEDASVSGTTVTFERAGSTLVEVALASDPNITAFATITVLPAALDALHLVTASGARSVAVGGSLTFEVSGTDAFGNDVPLDDLDVTLTSDHATDVVQGMTVRFPTASPHVITATAGEVSTSLSIEVIPAATAPAAQGLPATGTDTSTLTALAIALLVLGGVLLGLRARHGVRERAARPLA